MRIELRHICLDCAKYAAYIDSFRSIDAMSFIPCGMLVDNVKLSLRQFGANRGIIATLAYNLKSICAIVTKLGNWMNISLPKRYAPFLHQLRRNAELV